MMIACGKMRERKEANVAMVQRNPKEGDDTVNLKREKIRDKKPS